MEEKRVGHTQVYTPSLGLGANAVGGYNLFPNLDDETGKEIVRTALNNGIKMIDTAFRYGNGHSEELIGEVLKDYSRSRIILATKASHDGSRHNNHPDFLKQSVEDALRRLQTEYIDIFYIHRPDEDTPKAEAVGALHELKEEGKIRAIGISNFSLEQIQEANANNYVDVVEDEYSLLHRHAETELFPYLKKKHISFVPYFPLASGLLTGKYTEETPFPEGDIRQKNPDFQGERFKDILQKVSRLKSLANKNDCIVSQLVLAWYMKNPQVTAVIPGAKRPEQVIENAKAMDVHLSMDTYREIDTLFK